jgi:hypothetical protein
MAHRFDRLFAASMLALAATAHPLAQEAANRAQIVRAQEGMVWAFMVPLAIITAICGFAYLCRALIEHRRWLRATKLEAEAQARILDRLSASQDLLTYLQSPASQRMLSLSPVSPTVHPASGPAARILWSVQTGIVLILAGIGIWIGANQAYHALEEIADVLHMVAILVVAVGIGFALSAAVSLTLSRRLGLIEEPTRSNS